MKRGKNVFLYAISVVFSCMFFALFSINKVSAEEVDYTIEASCVDTECSSYSLDKINLITTVYDTFTIPDTFNSKNITIINSNVFNTPVTINQNLNIPESVLEINDNAFSNVIVLDEFSLPTTISKVGSKIFSDNIVRNVYISAF